MLLNIRCRIDTCLATITPNANRRFGRRRHGLYKKVPSHTRSFPGPRLELDIIVLTSIAVIKVLGSFPFESFLCHIEIASVTFDKTTWILFYSFLFYNSYFLLHNLFLFLASHCCFSCLLDFPFYFNIDCFILPIFDFLTLFPLLCTRAT